MSDLRRQVRSGAIWRISAQLLNAPTRLATSIILVRCLSRELYGVYGFLLSISAMLIYIVSLGIQHAIGRYVPEFVERKQYGLIVRLVGWMIALRALIVLALLAFLGFFWGQFASFFQFPSGISQYLFLILLFFFMQRVCEIFGGIFHTAMLDIRTIAIHDVLKPLVFIGGVVAAYLHGISLASLLRALLAAELFSALFYGSSFVRHCYRLLRMEENTGMTFSKMEWKRIRRYSFYNAFYILGGAIVGVSMDSFIVARFFGMEKVALYTFGVNLVLTAHGCNPVVLFKPILSNLFVRRYYQNKDYTVLSFSSRMVSKLGLFIALPTAVSVCILARSLIVYVYKPEYAAAVPVIIAFSVILCSRVLSFGLTCIINTLEMVRTLLVLNVLAVYNILMALFLAPRIGLLGVALATCSAEVIWFLILYALVRFRAGIRNTVFSKSQLIIVVNTGLLAAFLYGLRGWISGVAALLTVIVIGAVFYLVSSYLTKPFTSEERELINKTLGRRLWVF